MAARCVVCLYDIAAMINESELTISRMIIRFEVHVWNSNKRRNVNWNLFNVPIFSQTSFDIIVE